MLANRSMPSSTVIPQLPYNDVITAAEWLERAVGFTTRLRIADHPIQMNVGDGHVVLVQGTGRVSLMVRVPDVDAHHSTPPSTAAATPGHSRNPSTTRRRKGGAGRP